MLPTIDDGVGVDLTHSKSVPAADFFTHVIYDTFTLGIALVMRLESMYKAIQASFKKVVDVDHCRHRWFQYCDLVAIINHEYDIPSNNNIKYAQLNLALQ